MNIKELRERAGISQAELSKKTGIPKERIAKWEQRNTLPKTIDAEKLRTYFNEPHEDKSTHKPVSVSEVEFLRSLLTSKENELKLSSELIEAQKKTITSLETQITLMGKKISPEIKDVDDGKANLPNTNRPGLIN